jgi:hypothetical protein
MLTKRLAGLIVVLFVVSSVSATKSRIIPRGTWGGEQISIWAEPSAAAIEYSCAKGTIKGPLVVDSKGRFKLTGTHTVERGGPVRSGETGNARPAVYTGVVTGKRLTLTVTLTDTNETVGTFTLTQGKQARLFRCM